MILKQDDLRLVGTHHPYFGDIFVSDVWQEVKKKFRYDTKIYHKELILLLNFSKDPKVKVYLSPHNFLTFTVILPLLIKLLRVLWVHTVHMAHGFLRTRQQ